MRSNNYTRRERPTERSLSIGTRLLNRGESCIKSRVVSRVLLPFDFITESNQERPKRDTERGNCSRERISFLSLLPFSRFEFSLTSGEIQVSLTTITYPYIGSIWVIVPSIHFLHHPRVTQHCIKTFENQKSSSSFMKIKSRIRREAHVKNMETQRKSREEERVSAKHSLSVALILQN
jgi:hypothetical protein